MQYAFRWRGGKALCRYFTSAILAPCRLKGSESGQRFPTHWLWQTGKDFSPHSSGSVNHLSRFFLLRLIQIGGVRGSDCVVA